MPANPATPADAERLRQSDAEAAMLTHIRQAGLPEPETEYRFHPKRRWRFDGAYERERVAYEVEGGTWARGRHTRGAGFERDCEKYNAAALLSWRVFRFTTAMVEDGRAVATLELALARCDSGMPKGYKFKRIRCERCGQEVAENWILQHWRSGCTKGGHPAPGAGDERRD